MSGNLRLNGATSGYSELAAPDVAGDQTFTFPATGGTLAIASNNTAGVPVPGYQQGTWNGVLNGSASGDTTVTDRSFAWSRVGQTVFLYFALAAGNKVTSGDITIKNLPYSASTICQQYTGMIGDRGPTTYGSGFTDQYIRISSVGGPNQPIQVMQKSSNNHATFSSGSLPTNFVMRGEISYITDDTTWTPANGATVS